MFVREREGGRDGEGDREGKREGEREGGRFTIKSIQCAVYLPKIKTFK